MSQHPSFAGRWSAVLLCVLGGSAAAAAPVALDERMPVPRAVDQQGLKARAADFRAAFEQKAQPGSVPGAFLRDAATYHQLGDMIFSIEQGLGEGRALDLTELGFTRRATGTYTIKAREAPQWRPFDSFLNVLSKDSGAEGHLFALKQRGFRDQDVAILRSYLGSHRPEQISLPQNELLTEKFAASVVERRKRGAPIPREEVQALNYRATRNANEARRVWAVGLLDALDPQRQRILMSYFEELDITFAFDVSKAGRAHVDAETSQALDYLASGRYRQDFARQKTELLQKEMPQ
jgi:hypothetical protein